jgi:hypothetical protein
MRCVKATASFAARSACDEIVQEDFRAEAFDTGAIFAIGGIDPPRGAVFTKHSGMAGNIVVHRTFHFSTPADHSGCMVTSRRRALVETGMKPTLL